MPEHPSKVRIYPRTAAPFGAPLVQDEAVLPSGYYAWLETPQYARVIENKHLLGHIKQSWLASGSVYGYRKGRDDLLALGES